MFNSVFSFIFVTYGGFLVFVLIMTNNLSLVLQSELENLYKDTMRTLSSLSF